MSVRKRINKRLFPTIMAMSSKEYIIPEFEVKLKFNRRFDIEIYDIDSNLVCGMLSNNKKIEVTYNKVYYKPQSTCSWFGIKEDHEVEIHYKDKLSGLLGWQSGIVKSVTGAEYSVELTGLFGGLGVVETVDNFQIRPINRTSCLEQDDLTKIVIPIPEPCQEYLETGLENFWTLKKFLKACVVRRLSPCELLIISDDSDCLKTTERICDEYFEYVLKRYVLYKRYKVMESKMQMIDNIKSIEIFFVSKEIISFAMGKANENLYKAEQLPGVIYIRYIPEKEAFEVYGSMADSVKQARSLLKYSKTTYNISNPIFVKYFGDGSVLVELATSSSITITLKDSKNNTTAIDLIGEVANVQSFIKFIRLRFEVYKEIFTGRKKHFLMKEFDAFKLKMLNKATILTDAATKKKGKTVFPIKKRGQFKKQDRQRKKKPKPNSKRPLRGKQRVKLPTAEKGMKFEETTSEATKSPLEEQAAELAMKFEETTSDDTSEDTKSSLEEQAVKLATAEKRMKFEETTSESPFEETTSESPFEEQAAKFATAEKRMKFEETTSESPFEEQAAKLATAEDKKTSLEGQTIKPVAAVDEAIEYKSSKGQFDKLDEKIKFFEAQLSKFCESLECNTSTSHRPKHKVKKSRKLRNKLYTIVTSQENLVEHTSDEEEIKPTFQRAQNQLKCDKLRRKIKMVLSFPMSASRLETSFLPQENRFSRFDLLETVVEVDEEEDSELQPHQDNNDEETQKDKDNPPDTQKKSKRRRRRRRRAQHQ